MLVMSAKYFYILSVFLLSLLLYFPVNKLIYVLSVRRLEKKTSSKLTEIDLKGQLIRSRVISIILVVLFSGLFNFKYY